MISAALRRARGSRFESNAWSALSPVREELFGIERLEQHAESLAMAQQISPRPPSVLPLQTRLSDNAAALLVAYRVSAADMDGGHGVVPAAEWLLDNYHLIEEQIREIRDDLPPGYYRQLPKLAAGPFAGYPRVFGLAWAFVAHTDSHLDPDILRRFIVAYQRVQPLTIGELWAVAITLRIVLIENLRRLADQIVAGRRERADADAFADSLLASGSARRALDTDIAARSKAPLSEVFAAQLAKRLRDQDPRTTPALDWLTERLRQQDVSIGDVVQHAQQRLGASNVTVRNVITSMRLISDIDWADLFESVSLVDERLRGESAFATMDFATRDQYRAAIEVLSRGSPSSELEIADLALANARAARAAASEPAEAERVGDPGYHLIAEGRGELERGIGFRPQPRLWISRLGIRLGIGGYAGAILIATATLLALALWALAAAGVWIGGAIAFAVVGFVPASEAAVALVNRVITWSFGASTLPGLELATGVPETLRTLVAVPTLLTGEADMLEQIERLEVHHLAGSGGDLTFALLSDGVDAGAETIAGEEHTLSVAAAAIDALNRRYGPGPGGDRFLLLHRRRVFNAGDGVWMGWERKRGKLHELNRLLRGATDTNFIPVAGQAPHVPADVRFVITLDADTKLPRDAARKLVGKMAHPLNRPKFDPTQHRVVGGYAILQPRVTPTLPVGREGSMYQRIFSGPGGMDPYAAAISDVYQDLFGEGSYTGKGIYDVDAFEAALAGRVAENTLLSHDLFEGVFARAGLASDVEVVEEFPSRYDVAAKRQHRWIRGDWQLLPWILGHWVGDAAMPALGRLKMLDNLRRSLLAPATLLTLALCWLLPPPPSAAIGILLVLASMAIPAFLPVLFSLLPRRAGIRLRNHFGMLGSVSRLAFAQVALAVVFLPDQAWRAGDAVVRTLVRLFATRLRLLEWTTAASSAAAPRLSVGGFYHGMWGGLTLGLGLAVLALAVAPAAWPLVAPFAALWAAAPALAFRISRAATAAARQAISDAEATQLRLIARRTWRYFETFVTPTDNMLPPDNFQEDPAPVLAHRTSPTNIGLYLLSAVAARDFGWAGTTETTERLEATFASMRQLPRFNGHFFNWYDTRDLRRLDPPYVSSVDSGNLAGHLIALANACEEWTDPASRADVRAGMADALRLARETADALPLRPGQERHPLVGVLDEMDTLVNGALAIGSITPQLNRLADRAAETVRRSVPLADGVDVPEVLFWLEALKRLAREHLRDALAAAAPHDLTDRLRAIADSAREIALAMDFGFLLDPERKLLSIGYSLADNGLDQNCYDLLASEARLASLFAVAKGDAPTRHWFRLGRTATPIGTSSVLISWSGSMFEYLMPSLVMRAPAGSLLEQTNRLVVGRQQAYGRSLGIPWGISESAYNARDIEFTYQYSNFGVPGLGLKRGLARNTVVAPYATALAAMIDPRGALQNYARLAQIGALGSHGFYEALDFTRSRLPADQSVAIVRAYMAHHQGMTIVAVANALNAGRMRERFHREPMIQASELLLQERTPREVAMAPARSDELKSTRSEAAGEIATVRRLSGATVGPPETHLLSNGRYAVMLTATGAGYSRWHDVAVTRWREDPTRDDWGSYVVLKEAHGNKTWSGAAKPIGHLADYEDVVFAEDHAEFVRRDGGLTTTMDVLVSAEDDGEVRRVSLVNNGRRAREIELTSYAELVLAPAAADNAHPAFSKMFVQTEFVSEFGALIATRRPRAHDEPRVWAAHFAVVEGELAADLQYETDRTRFLGRGQAIGRAAAVVGGAPLSNTVGTVLDPIFSLRQRVLVPHGKVARISFWTVVAASRAEVLDLVDKHHDRNAYDRAKTLAWTQGQVQLRHLDVAAGEAADFQRLASPILYADPRFKASGEAIAQGAGPQSDLWPHGISGDLPIVLMRIDDLADIGQVRQLLRAHEYWRMKRLAVDVVIVNELASSYIQDLQIAIETAVRSSQSRPRLGDALARGSVYTLRADLLGPEARTLIRATARVVLHARRGPLADQLARMPAPSGAGPADRAPRAAPGSEAAPGRAVFSLEFFNGFGGFDKDGREYVTVLDGDRTTPAPWINVIATTGFGFQVAAEGGGYTWAENSRDNQLTPWSNDPVTDGAGEALYVRDDVTGALWSPTAQPIRDGGHYVARHGFGYSRFEHEANGIDLTLLQFVPVADPLKISRLTVRNLSDRPRRLSIAAFAEWVLGTSRGAATPFLMTDLDATGAIFARNPWSIAFPGRVAFADLGGRQTSWTADRTEFLGRDGDLGAPAALATGRPLSGRTGAGLDPCAALATTIELGAGETTEIVWLIGQATSAEAAADLVSRWRSADLDGALAAVTAHWDTLLRTVQVKTPDRAMDIMLNGWLLYQTLACRVLARSAFYQASGAYGFRDQLQDGMALSFAQPEETRRHLLRAAGRQFAEGDVQHWWLPHSGQGVRTRISDDRVWLAFAAATYVAASGDEAVLDAAMPFIEGPPLAEGAHDAFFQPMVADEAVTLFEHCARGLDQCLLLTGANGLPLIGTGDWNDGMNRVGEAGRGESVWLGWLLVRTIALFAPQADRRDPARALRWRAHATSVLTALEQVAWDGAWYRRATYDDGTWLGSKDGDECHIDSIAQSWAVLSEAADPARAAQAMASLDRELVRPADGLALLFTPPFDATPREPGYIKGYPPGLRENGGQYSHAAMWAVLAFAKLGDGAKAAELFSLLNPINHALTPEAVARYRVEPYVVAADVYSVAPHVGRGGWTWYTGSAAWMYRAGIEGILGIRREGAFLVIVPCIPPAWPGFEAMITVGSTRYEIEVENPAQTSAAPQHVVLDGAPIECVEGRVRVPLDGAPHTLSIRLA